MANYKLDYTGEQVNTAIGNALNGGGGGGAIGGGFTVTTRVFMGSATILILGSYAGKFGWHKITINQMSTPTIRNAVMMCVLSVAEDATSIQTSILLYDFSGNISEYSNLAVNKMYYIRQDVELQITD